MNRTQFRKTLISNCRKENGGKIYCVECGKKEYTENQIVADHKNNNDKDHRIENGQLLCIAHNKKKNPSKITAYLKTKGLTFDQIYTETERQIIQNRLAIGTVAMARNIHGKNNLKTWLLKSLKKTPLMLLTEFIESGAEIAGVEMSTIEKWIPPMTSNEGKFAIRTIKKLKYIMTKQSAKDFDSDNQRTK